MNKKILLISILTPVVFTPLISLSMKNNDEIKVSDSPKTLKEVKQHENTSNKLNLDGFDSNKIVKYKITQEQFLEIAQEAQKNSIVLNWMSSVFENNMNFESATKFLFSLELNQKTKEFMFNGLYDKMSTIESKLISNIKAIEAKNQVRSQYVQVNGTYLKNIDGSNIINKGRSRTTPEIHDSMFGDDVSYIRYDTQDVYNIYTKGLDKKFVKRLEIAIKNVNASKHILDVGIRSIGFLLPDQIGAEVDPLVIEIFLTNIYNGWNWFGLSDDVNFLRANTDWLKKIGMYTSDLQEILEGYSILTNPYYYLNDWRYMSTNIIGRFSGFLWSVKEPTFITKILAIGIHAANEILNFPTGNGYSPIENMHDHGLNDWNSQLRNNFSAIGSLAQQASQTSSNKFYDGVTDGWWTLPKLYLKWQGKRDWIDVSPGDSFNWGNKIPPRY